MPMTQSATAVATPPRKKLFYRINEVSKMTGLKPYVLRYWETEFSELSPEKDGSDQRRYRAKDIDTVLAIRKLLYEDRFTIKGARKQLKSEMKQMKATKTKKRISIKTGATAAKKKGRTKASIKSGRSLDQSLHMLRAEVTELLNILNP